MNRILFRDLEECRRLSVKDPRLEHVRGVLRLGVGDSFDVGLENGPVGKARITQIERDFVWLNIDWGERPPVPPKVTGFVAYARPQTMRKVLKDAATQGLYRLILFPGEKSDPAYANSRLWKENAYHEYLRQGAEQAFDTWIPEVIRAESFSEGLSAIAADSQRLCLDNYEAPSRLSACSFSSEASIAYAIGPERGWSRGERVQLREGGFQLVSLNERVLRVEAAFGIGLALIHAGMGYL